MTQGPVDSCRSDSSEYVLERGQTDGGEEEDQQPVETRSVTEGRTKGRPEGRPEEVDSQKVGSQEVGPQKVHQAGGREVQAGERAEGRRQESPGDQVERRPGASAQRDFPDQRSGVCRDQGRGPNPGIPAQEETDQEGEERGWRLQPIPGDQGRSEVRPAGRGYSERPGPRARRRPRSVAVARGHGLTAPLARPPGGIPLRKTPDRDKPH